MEARCRAVEILSEELTLVTVFSGGYSGAIEAHCRAVEVLSGAMQTHSGAMLDILEQ
jgi:hypothetical protein